MSFWNIFSNDGEKYAQIGVEILDRPRAGYYPVENKEKVQIINESTPTITFEDIQDSIKEELIKISDKINTIEEEDIKIQELQKQLKAFKNDNKVIYDKIKTLQSVGLTSTPSSVTLLTKLTEKEKFINSKIAEITNKINKLKVINDITKQYLLEYPTFKFIDTESFTNILKKYKLVLGDSSQYCKEIPDNVLTNIVKFKDKIDSSKTYNHIVHERYGSSNWRDSRYILERSSNKYFNIRNDYQDTSSRRVIFTHCKSDLVIAAPLNHFKNEVVSLEKRFSDRSSKTVDIPVFKVDVNTREFVININALNNLAEHNNEISRQLDDPIACLRVKHGFIIIDAWDKEALIPEINRETLN